MNSSKDPTTSIKATPTSKASQPKKKGLTGTLIDGVMSGLGTVVGAIEGTFGVGHSPDTKESEGKAHSEKEKGKKEAVAMKKAVNSKNSKAALSKAQTSKPQKVSRAKQASIHALAISSVKTKSKAQRHR